VKVEWLVGEETKNIEKLRALCATLVFVKLPSYLIIEVLCLVGSIDSTRTCTPQN